MAVYKEHGLRENISTNGIFLGVLVVALAPIIFKVSGLHDNFSSVLCTVFTTGVLMICYLAYWKRLVSSKFGWLFIINVGSLLISVLLNGSLGVIAIHINMLLLINLFNNITFSSKQVCFTHILVGAYLLSWILTLNYKLAWRAVFFDPSGKYINPCTVAIITLACYYSLFVVIDVTVKKFWVKTPIIIVMSILTLYNIYLSVCRSSLLALLAFWVFCILEKFVIRKYRKITIFLIFATILIPVIYIVLYNVVDDWEFFGESFFTGREVVWVSTFENISEGVFFGAGSENSIKLGHTLMDDAHNLVLGVWKNLGLIPVISLFVLFTQGKNLKWISTNNKKSKLMFLSCFIASMSETLLNSSEFYMFFIPLLMTIRSDNHEKRKNRFIG